MEIKTFEFWIKDSFYGFKAAKRYTHKFTEERLAKLVKMLEAHRTSVETALSGFFNDDAKSWKSFKMSLWVAIPDNIQTRIEQTIYKWAVEDDPQLPRKLAQDAKRKATTMGGALW